MIIHHHFLLLHTWFELIFRIKLWLEGRCGEQYCDDLGRTAILVLDYSLGNLDTLTTTLFIHFPWEIIISVALLVSKKNHNR